MHKIEVRGQPPMPPVKFRLRMLVWIFHTGHLLKVYKTFPKWKITKHFQSEKLQKGSLLTKQRKQKEPYGLKICQQGFLKVVFRTTAVWQWTALTDGPQGGSRTSWTSRALQFKLYTSSLVHQILCTTSLFAVLSWDI